MEKQQFKKQVLDWLKENNIDIGEKKVRVFNSRRYGLEVRIYSKPIEFPNTRKSHRKMKEPTDEFNSTYGIHSTKISSYIHINIDDFKNEEEKQFILDNFKYQ